MTTTLNQVAQTLSNMHATLYFASRVYYKSLIALQAELRERIERYSQLWIGCQRQLAAEEISVMVIQGLSKMRILKD
ncbi:hypothetical protein E3N88_39713 [Mikania micrantha]|uniref:Uncharacterized protein n=1 Tax=Mikania micrantha TaxID=192012 RepID=A0A5N6LKN4_9ASTR|nr:hypothetical protein E3N88_39713 [Mikania micrantha]